VAGHVLGVMQCANRAVKGALTVSYLQNKVKVPLTSPKAPRGGGVEI
jgi:hypothetical protein